MSLLLLFGGSGGPTPIPPAAPSICYPTSALVTRGLPGRGNTSSTSVGPDTSANVAVAAATASGFAYTLGGAGTIMLAGGPYTPPAGANTSANVTRSSTSSLTQRRVTASRYGC